MAEWVRLCAAADVPAAGQVSEAEANGQVFCLANIGGELRVLDNLCPHRDGPLGQGWVKGESVVCPWHAWAFDSKTGIAEPPEEAKVQVFPVRVVDESVFVEVP